MRRICTARARRSSSGASSRNAYGFAFRISCENCDGTGVSTARVRIAATANSVQHAPQPVDVHRLGEHVLHHLLHQRVIGNLDVADNVLLARGHVGKDRRQKIVAANALNLRRNLLAALEAQQRQRAVGVPAPARREDGRGQRRLLQNFLHRLGLQIVKDVAQRKAVLLGQRDVQSVVGGCGLQLKIERAAETLAQRQSPGLVDARRRTARG